MIRFFAVIGFLNAFLFVLLTWWNFLGHHAFPLLSAEGVIGPVVLTAFLLVPLVLLGRLRETGIFPALLIFLFLDMVFGFSNRPFWEAAPRPAAGFEKELFFSSYFWAVSLLSGISVPITRVAKFNYLLAFLAAMGTGLWLRGKLHRMVLIGLAAMTVATFLKPVFFPQDLIQQETRSVHLSSPQGLPNILFLILDEQIGVEGIPELGPEITRAKENWIRAYVANGFVVFGRAHSNYLDSHNSIPSLLNGKIFLQNDDKRVQVNENRIVEEWIREGWAPNFYQTDYMEFCRAFKGRYRKCYEYRSNSMGYLKDNVPLRQKMPFLINAYLRAHQSELLKRIFGPLLRLTGVKTDRIGPIPVMEVMDELKRDLGTYPQGTVFFAHLMMPHYPYVFDSACRLKPVSRWENRSEEKTDSNSPEDWTRRYGLYLEQMACLHHKIGELFAVMRENGSFEEATVVILGDHGSRIISKPILWKNKEQLTQRDFVDGFSAFLAIKPGSRYRSLWGEEGRYEAGKVPAVQVLKSLHSPLFQEEAREPKFQQIYLKNDWEDFSLHSLEMPDF